MKIQQIEITENGNIQIKYLRDSVEDYMVDGIFDPELPKTHRMLLRREEQTEEQMEASNTLSRLLEFTDIS